MKKTGAVANVVLIGSLLSLLVACAPAASDTQAELEAEIQAAASADGGLPQGAIQVSDGAYAVPVAVNDEGCEQFSEWSTKGAARQIIYFHDGSGGFTAIKSAEHSCNAEMVQVGEDDRGCALYRAEQPDGSATDVDYYRGTSGFTVNPDNADCTG